MKIKFIQNVFDVLRGKLKLKITLERRKKNKKEEEIKNKNKPKLKLPLPDIICNIKKETEGGGDFLLEIMTYLIKL